jgi:F-type H+-transporting ATPase subunit b
MELIEKLGLDLKLLIAQVISFIIILTVLNLLLYKPIFKVLDKRRKMIEKSVEDAKKAEEQVKGIAEEKTKVLASASAEAIAIMEKAKKNGEDEYKKLVEKAKKEMDTLAQRHKMQMEEEKNRMISEAKKEIAGLVIMSAEKILKREFSKNDQHRLSDAIKDELKSLEINAKQ